MAWIESHQSLRGHPKTWKLSRALGVARPHAVGLLQFLWWWALDYAPDGDLSGFSDADLAGAAGWEGDPAALVSALDSAGFTKKTARRNQFTAPGRHINDWDEYAGRLITKRVANKERMRLKREAARADNVQRTNSTRTGATVPNRTVPYPTPLPPSPTGAERERNADAGTQPEDPRTREALTQLNLGRGPEDGPPTTALTAGLKTMPGRRLSQADTHERVRKLRRQAENEEPSVKFTDLEEVRKTP